MNIAAGSVLNMTPAGNDWVLAFRLEDETEETICPVIGWANVVKHTLKDGATRTEVEPAFVWGNQVWTESELREHGQNVQQVQIRRTWDAPLATPAPVV